MQLRSATHLRYSPYLMGIFLGYIFFKNRGKKVHLSKVSCSLIVIFLLFWSIHKKSDLFHFFSLLDMEYGRMVNFDYRNNTYHFRSLSIFHARYWHWANPFCTFLIIWSNIMDSCSWLHNICMSSRVWRSDKYDFIIIILATTFQTYLRYLHHP